MTCDEDRDPRVQKGRGSPGRERGNGNGERGGATVASKNGPGGSKRRWVPAELSLIRAEAALLPAETALLRAEMRLVPAEMPLAPAEMPFVPAEIRLVQAEMPLGRANRAKASIFAKRRAGASLSGGPASSYVLGRLWVTPGSRATPALGSPNAETTSSVVMPSRSFAVISCSLGNASR